MPLGVGCDAGAGLEVRQHVGDIGVFGAARVADTLGLVVELGELHVGPADVAHGPMALAAVMPAEEGREGRVAVRALLAFGRGGGRL